MYHVQFGFSLVRVLVCLQTSVCNESFRRRSCCRCCCCRSCAHSKRTYMPVSHATLPRRRRRRRRCVVAYFACIVLRRTAHEHTQARILCERMDFAHGKRARPCRVRFACVCERACSRCCLHCALLCAAHVPALGRICPVCTRAETERVSWLLSSSLNGEGF